MDCWAGRSVIRNGADQIHFNTQVREITATLKKWQNCCNQVWHDIVRYSNFTAEQTTYEIDELHVTKILKVRKHHTWEMVHVAIFILTTPTHPLYSIQNLARSSNWPILPKSSLTMHNLRKSIKDVRQTLDGGTLAVCQQASTVVEFWMKITLPYLLVLLQKLLSNA